MRRVFSNSLPTTNTPKTDHSRRKKRWTTPHRRGRRLTRSLKRLLFVDVHRSTSPSRATSRDTLNIKNTLCCFSTMPCQEMHTHAHPSVRRSETHDAVHSKRLLHRKNTFTYLFIYASEFQAKNEWEPRYESLGDDSAAVVACSYRWYKNKTLTGSLLPKTLMVGRTNAPTVPLTRGHRFRFYHDTSGGLVARHTPPIQK